MAKGHPDFNPVLATQASSWAQNNGTTPFDAIPAPGAGFRLVLRRLHVSATLAGNPVVIQEVTPANVAVQVLISCNVAAGGFYPFVFEGFPLADGNKVRVTNIPAGNIQVHSAYAIVQV